jgi:phytoene desaturase
MATEGLKMNVFQKLDRYAKKFFKSARARQILEYNIVFLGGAPKKSPALYSIMSHVDLNLGVWYPMGGIWKLPDALYELAKEMGVEFSLNDEVKSIVAEQKRAKKIISERGETEVDAVVASAEYPHVEMELLDSNHRTYPEKYWEKKTMAPSMYLVYLGLDKKIKPLAHHNFYFPEDWDPHFKSLFDKKAWPENPAYYVGCPSKTDPSVAPEGGELVFLLVPVAPGLEDSDEVRESYEQKILDHLEKTLGENIRDHIVIKKVFSHRDFEKTYHAYKGTALGLAHTLFQTAIFRPSNRSRKVKNLYFTGQYTNPGIGVPMALISSEIVSNKIKKEIS